MRPQFVIATSAIAAGAINSLVLRLPTYVANYWGDWEIFWVAAHLPTFLYRKFDLLPFAYPPTALIALFPFSLLSVWVSFAVWSLLGLAALFFAGRSIAPSKTVLLALLMPPCFWGLLAGQTSLFMGALSILAVTKRSGVLFGLGVAMKPQALFALPFTDWNWRLALTAVAASVSLVALSVLLFGWGMWSDWLAALKAFREIVASRGISMSDAGTAGLAYNLGLPAWIYFVGATLGAVCTWTVCRATDDPLERFAAFACGSILISPYTLGYDVAGLSIAAMAMLLDKEHSLARWVAAGWIVSGVLPAIGVVAMAGTLAWEYRIKTADLRLSASTLS